jgi:hypothetical protein
MKTVLRFRQPRLPVGWIRSKPDRGLTVSCRVGSGTVIEREVPRQVGSRFRCVFIGFQIHLFLFHGSPKSFNEHVIPPTTLAVHADGNTVGFEHAGELEARKLTSLIGIHDLGDTILGNGFLQGADTELRMHRVREFPSQDLSAMPVHHCDEIQEPSAPWKVRDIHRPDLVRSVDDQVPQQIRIDRMCRMRLTGVFLAVNRLDPHQSHQAPYPSSSDTDVATLPQQISKHPSARKGIIEMQSVDQRHPSDIGVRRPLRAVVSRRSGIPNTFACCVTDSLWFGSIIFLRSASPLW